MFEALLWAAVSLPIVAILVMAAVMAGCLMEALLWAVVSLPIVATIATVMAVCAIATPRRNPPEFTELQRAARVDPTSRRPDLSDAREGIELATL